MIIGLLVIILIVVFFDITRYKIPNACIVAVLAVMLLLVGILNGPPAAFISVVNCLCVIFLFFPFYLFGAIGAGDLKLMAVMGTVLSVKEMFYLLWVAFFIALILGVLKIILKKCIYIFSLDKNRYVSLFFENRVNKNSLRSKKLLLRIIEGFEGRLIIVSNQYFYKVVNYFVLMLKRGVLKNESYSIHFSIALLIAFVWIKM